MPVTTVTQEMGSFVQTSTNVMPDHVTPLMEYVPIFQDHLHADVLQDTLVMDLLAQILMSVLLIDHVMNVLSVIILLDHTSVRVCLDGWVMAQIVLT